MKLLLRISLVLVLILFATISYSSDACFSEKSTIKLESDLKQCEFDRAECVKCEEDKALADEEINTLKEKIKLQEQVIKLNEQALKQYKDLLDYQKRSYEDIIKQNKPSFFKELFNAVSFLGLGVLLGLVL